MEHVDGGTRLRGNFAALLSMGLLMVLWPLALVGEGIPQKDIVFLVAAIPPPPEDDSIAGQADLETVLQVQADRTPAQEARARQVAHHTVFDMLSKAFGETLTAEELPGVVAAFAEVHRKAHPFMLAAKGHFNRPRPYQRDDRVQPCLGDPPNSSYPSGHSAQSAVWATLLSTVFPEHTEAFQADMREAMWGRILGGVHYPTDTLAGSRLGKLIATYLLEKSDVQDLMADVRRDITERTSRMSTPRASRD